MSTLSRLRAFLRRRSAPKAEPGLETPKSIVAARQGHEARYALSREPKVINKSEEEARALEAFLKLEMKTKWDKTDFAMNEPVAWIGGKPLTVGQLWERYGPKPKPLVLVGARGMKPYLMTHKERKAHKEALSG